ncbi:MULTISPECIES: AMP-binding protein [unclassified Brenneria]|uniref:AMP-binding protein n=1 Tax=unclassified Brenneria TaxID=2634434 RepID=UPI0018F0755A|nr:AMP-binding protein [Brenneria sp. L3-3C-1]MBJ7224147.1 AMP-binding protein [Brenneria sp. L3-3C-1]MEE3645393.1 AMP-binding protein [Brenneria sp. L3_3C_1]
MKVITGHGKVLDYCDIIEKSKKMIGDLSELPKSCALCCWSEEKIDYIYCYETALLLGIPFIPLSSSIEYCVHHTLIECLPFSVLVYKNKSWDRFDKEGDNSIADWLDTAEMCFFTSGSMGEKKLIFLTRDNIRTAVSSIQDKLKYRYEDRVINFLPMAFDYGFYQYLLVKNVNGTLCLIDEGFSMGSVKRIDELNITILPLVPSMISVFYTLRGRVFNGCSIEKITSTGEPVSEGLIKQITSQFQKARFYTMYGLTECKRVSILTPDDDPDYKESVGRPISCSEIYIKNPDHQGIGEIVVTGTNVAIGSLIFGFKEKIRREYFQGTLETGDIGLIDSKGFLYVYGRNDALIKILGQRISTIEIENQTLDISGIITCKASADKSGCYLQCIVENGITESQIRKLLLKKMGTIASKIIITVTKDLSLSQNYKLIRPK